MQNNHNNNNNNILKKINSFFENTNSVFKLNLSFFTVGIFFMLLSLNYTNSNNPRSYIGAIFLSLWFISTPFLNPQQRDRIMIEVFKFIGAGFVAALLILYFIFTLSNINHIQTPRLILIDIIVSIVSIFISYYFIGRLILIMKAFKLLISKVYLIIFNSQNEDNSPLKILFKNISAFLLTISGVLATLVTVITAIKTIADTLGFLPK